MYGKTYGGNFVEKLENHGEITCILYTPTNTSGLKSKAYIPLRHKILVSGAGVGQYPPTPEFCVGDTNMLASEKANICISPNANPRRQPVEYRWRWVFWRWPCIFHVYFMYISCCLCIIFRVGYARIGTRKGRFQWNLGLRTIG